MRKQIIHFSLSLALLLLSLGANAGALKLYVPYPAGWQLREPLLQGNVLNYEARQRVGDKVVQHLQITAVSLPADKPAPDRDALKNLAEQLRTVILRTARESLIPINAFQDAQGYYFAATDKNPKPGEFTQMVEGVILNQGYLINFTLLTNAAKSEDVKAMIAALDGLSIR